MLGYGQAMKVHITLTESVRNDPAEKQRALEQLKEASEIADVNMSRFQRYGIVTGEIPVDRLERIRKLPFVQSVNADSVQRALGAAGQRRSTA